MGKARLEELASAWAQAQPEWARRRLLVLRLIAQHELSAAQIAAAVGVSRATVFNYLETAQQRGVGALLTRGHSGGPEPTLAGSTGPPSSSKCAWGNSVGRRRRWP